MNNYQTMPLMEEKEKKVKLDNQEVSAREFNETLENLKSSQRIIESSPDNFHLVERMFS